MPDFVKQLLKPLASLKLTVVLLALSMLLIYAGTWAQIDSGIWQVQKHYFHSLITWVNFSTFLPRPPAGKAPIPGGFYMPGGYLLGLLLLLNLIAAHVVRFKFTWKRTGIILIHLGLILLLVGEGITSTMAVESQMTIDEGNTATWSQDIRTAELAIVDPSSPTVDRVAAIPASQLKPGATIAHSALPVDVRVDDFFSNSAFLGPMQVQQMGGKVDARATAGAGVGVTVSGEPDATDARPDTPSAYVTLARNGQSLGTYLVSVLFDGPQQFEVDGRPYTIQLRFKRLYKPYSVHLIKFTHEIYPGTNTPKDFSSLVQLVDPSRGVDRQVRIWMNNPLRYNGETFYQASFDERTDKTTVLQIVSNPAWRLPYIACAIGALGLVVHFGMMLIGAFLKLKPAGTTVPWMSVPTLASIGFVGFVYVSTLFSLLSPVGPPTKFDLETFGALPVTFEGRTQPLDTLARNSLKIIYSRERAYSTAGRISPTAWIADVFGQPEKAANYPIFRINEPQLVGMLGLDPSKQWYSFREILEQKDKLQPELDKVQRVPEKSRDLFQAKVAELGEKLQRYILLGQMEDLFLVPPLEDPQKPWLPLGKAMQSTPQPPAAKTWLELISSFHDDQPGKFNSDVASYAQTVDQKLPRAAKKAQFEQLFNAFDPFTQCIALYLAAFVLAVGSWLFYGVHFRRGAIVAVLFALLIHTAGLIGRIYISGRPPVTNLASSAIFIAWGGVVLAIGLELFFRNGVGAACAAVMGFLSLLISDRLALSGDTMAVLQAVLDTNFWLATHVVIITLGYSATFLAGVLGIVYVIRGLFTDSLTKQASKDLARMIYAIVCFAVLFSFVGTILGGIWADQSWGRFWGWDPKENGAVLIVLANAILLHARWGGLVGPRGIACLAIFGNIVTAWSWFGVNMLGVGLHSYGFMQSALWWLLAFVMSQVVLIVIANFPLTWWRSYEVLTAVTAPPAKPGKSQQPPPRAMPSPA